MIEIVNLKFYKGECWRVDRGSALGNRFRIRKDGNRDEVIKKYDIWVRGEINRGNKVIIDELNFIKEEEVMEGIIRLGCWCFPLNCHGFILKRLLENW